MNPHLKSIPKWAWAASAGIGIGGVVLYTIRGRNAVTTSTDVADGTATPAGIPGVVVPAVNVGPDASSEQGVTGLQTAYNSTLAALLAQYGFGGGGAPTQVITQQKPSGAVKPMPVPIPPVPIKCVRAPCPQAGDLVPDPTPSTSAFTAPRPLVVDSGRVAPIVYRRPGVPV